MANKQANRKAFVDAVRAKGDVKYFDLGGGVDLAQGAPTTPPPSFTVPTGFNPALGLPATTQVANPALNSPNSNVTQGGLTGALTPQSTAAAALAPTTSLNYTPAVNAGVNGAIAGQGQFTGNLANQQALEQTFLNEGQGKGPNPAQAALAANTATNVANTAALAAGTRGASANSGLVAREAAQAGTAAQQGAVGQAATLQAQQELAAQAAAAQQQQAIASGVTSEQAANTGLFTGAAQAANTQNANTIANYANTQGINAATATANAANAQKTSGGILGGIASGIASIFAEGGEVPDETQPPVTPEGISKGFKKATGFDEGGPVGMGALTGALTGHVEGVTEADGPQSYVGKFLNGALSQDQQDPFAAGVGKLGESIGSDIGKTLGTNGMAKGGKVPAMVSPGEGYLPPQKVDKVKKGASPLKEAEKIPGKAKVKGDSMKNDTVPKTLESGGIVLPRTVMNSENPGQKAADFVNAVLAKKRARGK